MADRGIIFTGANVQAIMAGTKTQTRRVLKPQPVFENGWWRWHGGMWGQGNPTLMPGHSMYERAPAQPGDTLWVREAWRTLHTFDCLKASDLRGEAHKVTYEADPENRNPLWAFGRLRAAIHMPRELSRLTLTVTDVRVQRLQDISEADAKAEGVAMSWAEGQRRAGTWRQGYEVLWNSIHGKDAWDANPWVAAITFEVASRSGSPS